MRPDHVNILGKTYSIEYKENASEVDIHKRESLWGQIDYWTSSIRIYDSEGSGEQEVWDSIIHECLHGILQQTDLQREIKNKGLDEEHLVKLLTCGLVDMLFRNKWIKE